MLNGGLRLGPVGGTIVAETFVGMLQADRSSWLRCRPGWRPFLGRDDEFTMADLITFTDYGLKRSAVGGGAAGPGGGGPAAPHRAVRGNPARPGSEPVAPADRRGGERARAPRRAPGRCRSRGRGRARAGAAASTAGPDGPPSRSASSSACVRRRASPHTSTASSRARRSAAAARSSASWAAFHAAPAPSLASCARAAAPSRSAASARTSASAARASASCCARRASIASRDGRLGLVGRRAEPRLAVGDELLDALGGELAHLALGHLHAVAGTAGAALALARAARAAARLADGLLGPLGTALGRAQPALERGGARLGLAHALGGGEQLVIHAARAPAAPAGRRQAAPRRPRDGAARAGAARGRPRARRRRSSRRTGASRRWWTARCPSR